MEVIDAQIHLVLTDRPGRRWVPDYFTRTRGMTPQAGFALRAQFALSMDAETALSEMALAGVDAAVLYPTYLYGFDNSLEIEAARQYPDKYTVVGTADFFAPDVEQTLRGWREQGMKGFRLAPIDYDALQKGEYDRIFRVAEKLDYVVALMLRHPVPSALPEAFKRFTNVRFMIDHVGVGSAPPTMPAAENALENLPAVLEMARFPNVSLKLTGAPSLSKESFPFRDIWPAVRQLVAEFGADRVMWGSDLTRTNSLHHYHEAVDYLGLIDGISPADKEMVYAKTLRNLLRWPKRSLVAPDAPVGAVRAEA